jgi:hypothetical protein
MVGNPIGQRQSSEEGKPPKSRPMIVRIFRALKRYENRRRRRSKQEKSARDLMLARWTRYVGIFTAALVLVGIVTGIIFWRQLNVMQGQLDEMHSASIDTARLATAAQESGRRARDAEVRQLRAYIVLDPAMISFRSDQNTAVEVEYYIKNVGQTAALHLKVRSNVALFIWPIPDDFVLPSIREDPTAAFTENTVYPGFKDTNIGRAWSRTFSREEIRRAEWASIQRIYVFGVGIYNDVFGEERHSHFCYSWIGHKENDGSDPSGYSHVTVRWQPCGGDKNDFD